MMRTDLQRTPRAFALAVVCLLGTCGPALAQQSEAEGQRVPRLTVFGTLGYNQQWDDESNLGRGVTFNGGVGYRLTRRVWAEGVVYRLQHTRELTYYRVTEGPTGPSGTPYNASLTGSATYFLARVRYVMSASRIQPYVAGEVGVEHYTGNGWGAVLAPMADVPAPPAVSFTTMCTGGTAGIDVRVTRSTTVGPYFGILMADNDGVGGEVAVHGGVRIGFAW